MYECLINTEPLKCFTPPPTIHPESLNAPTCECRDIVLLIVVVIMLVMTVMIVEIPIIYRATLAITRREAC